MRPLCIYHGGCADGFTAAWAVWLALTPLGGVDLHPGTYGEAPPDVAGRDVIMVDFSYKRPVIEMMSDACRSLLILDHHATAEAELAGYPAPRVTGWVAHQEAVSWDHDTQTTHRAEPRAVFDMGRSGAQIAWDFFHGSLPRSLLVDYVGDRDLWQFKLPRSRAISAWLYSHPFDMEVWTLCGADMHLRFDQVADQGQAILRQHDKNVESLIRNTRREMVIGGYRVPVANVPHFMASDAGSILADGQPFSATYYDRKDARVFSLRSREGGIDVSSIACWYGGGGHRQAAGFQKPLGWEGDEA